MPFYNDLRPDADYEERDFALVFPEMTRDVKIRTIEGLLALKDGLATEIGARRTEENLLIASWNIKEFGHTTQRLPESHFYLAEIVSRFDLVALQEIKGSLSGLQKLMRLLGPKWDYLFNDITGGPAGNLERSAYLFNTDRVRLGGLSAEVVPWDDLIDETIEELDLDPSIRAIKRTPFMTSFEAGWKTFVLVNVHLHPGGDGEDARYRRSELALLTAALREKLDRDEFGRVRHLILTGDFNLYDGSTIGSVEGRQIDTESVAALAADDYVEVDALRGQRTNLRETAAYDRFFIRKSDYFQVASVGGQEVGGVFNPFEHVLTPAETDSYAAEMLAVYSGTSFDLDASEDRAQYFDSYWRRNQLSDHLPVWFELEIDSSMPFLRSKRDKLQEEAGDQ